ncbi:hypothetical protein Za10_0053 [Zymomonas mobilis subsp. mobilis NCIMB 11163]|nr:hypothetical protein Za10_0053 [Zymomonas mobilis subsp. mobilis NCIMB 11163]
MKVSRKVSFEDEAVFIKCLFLISYNNLGLLYNFYDYFFVIFHIK